MQPLKGEQLNFSRMNIMFTVAGHALSGGKRKTNRKNKSQNKSKSKSRSNKSQRKNRSNKSQRKSRR
jgi:hypothetical protein